MFETFSFLPPLSDAEMAKQVQYLLNNGWTPCIEFEDSEHAYADGHGWSGLDSSINSGYYDNRYWVMWKLPMYGCTNPEEVVAEIKMCTKVFPDCSSASLASTTSSKSNARLSWPTARRLTTPPAPLTSVNSKVKFFS